MVVYNSDNNPTTSQYVFGPPGAGGFTSTYQGGATDTVQIGIGRETDSNPQTTVYNPQQPTGITTTAPGPDIDTVIIGGNPPGGCDCRHHASYCNRNRHHCSSRFTCVIFNAWGHNLRDSFGQQSHNCRLYDRSECSRWLHLDLSRTEPGYHFNRSVGFLVNKLSAFSPNSHHDSPSGDNEQFDRNKPAASHLQPKRWRRHLLSSIQ